MFELVLVELQDNIRRLGIKKLPVLFGMEDVIINKSEITLKFDDNKDLLMYKLIHLYICSMREDYGHSEGFWEMMGVYLRRACEMGLMIRENVPGDFYWPGGSN